MVGVGYAVPGDGPESHGDHALPFQETTLIERQAMEQRRLARLARMEMYAAKDFDPLTLDVEQLGIFDADLALAAHFAATNDDYKRRGFSVPYAGELTSAQVERLQALRAAMEASSGAQIGSGVETNQTPSAGSFAAKVRKVESFTGHAASADALNSGLTLER